MNRRRRRLPPDKRLDWRDPDMPVLGQSGREIDHNKMNFVANLRLEQTREPDFRHDPTYNLRRNHR